MYLMLAIIAVASYFIGSISPGIMLGKRLQGIDIREFGSGNTGATNVLRVLGPVPALVAFLIDGLKGAAAVGIGIMYGHSLAPYICGAAAIIGHNWPIYGGFKGGKGMATAAGIALTLYPALGLFLVGIFTLVVVVSRYVSLASIVSAAISIPIIILAHKPIEAIVFFTFLALLIIWRHKSNIQRLLQGCENKLSMPKRH